MFKLIIATPEKLEPNDMTMAAYVFEQTGESELVEEVRAASLKSAMSLNENKVALVETSSNSTVLLNQAAK